MIRLRSVKTFLLLKINYSEYFDTRLKIYLIIKFKQVYANEDDIDYSSNTEDF